MERNSKRQPLNWVIKEKINHFSQQEDSSAKTVSSSSQCINLNSIPVLNFDEIDDCEAE